MAPATPGGEYAAAQYTQPWAPAAEREKNRPVRCALLTGSHWAPPTPRLFRARSRGGSSRYSHHKSTRTGVVTGLDLAHRIGNLEFGRTATISLCMVNYWIAEMEPAHGNGVPSRMIPGHGGARRARSGCCSGSQWVLYIRAADRGRNARRAPAL